MVHGQTPSDHGSHFDNLLEYRDDFNSLSKLRSGKESSSYASDGSHQFLALPWVDNRGLSSFLDWENGLSCRDNEAHQFMPLPSAYITDVSRSDWKRDTVRNQVSNLLLEDVQPLTKGKSASANELGSNIQSEPYDHHGWDPMLSVTSVPKRLSFPCQIREQSVVPYALSNTSWQPEFSRSLEHCPSRSVGLEGEDLTDAGLFGNSAAELLSAFDQPHEKCTSSKKLDFRDGVLDNNGFSGISNFHASESNSFVLKPNTSCLDSICSTSGYPFEQGSKSFCDSAVRISCLAGMETEAELFDNSDTGLAHGMDLVPVTFIASSFSKYPGIVDRHHDPKDRNSILPVGADDACLDSLSPYSEHPCKQNWENTSDFSTELWASSHHVQSHGGSLGAMFGFTSDQSICNDFEDDHSMALVADNPKSSYFGTSDRAFFDSRSTMDSIRETPMLSLDCDSTHQTNLLDLVSRRKSSKNIDLRTDIYGAKPVMGQIRTDGQKIKSELKRTTDSDNAHVEEKLAASDNFSGTKSNATSLKMLLAKETSKEVESKSNPPSVIARLMGLVEDFPAKEPVLHHAKRDFRENQSCNHPEQIEKASQQQGQHHSMQPMTQVIDPSCETIEYNGVHEGCKEKARMSIFQGQSSQKTRYSENNSGRMDVVPEKFRQAKYLVTKENVLRSGALQEYLDVLSSEEDLFPKFREEPILARPMSGLRTTPAPPQTRITVLKPMRAVQSDVARQSTTEWAIEQNALEMRRFHQRSSSKEGTPSQPSRIVLLRPTPGKPSVTKAKLTPKATPFRLIDRKNFKTVLDAHGATLGSKVVVHDIIRHQQDGQDQRDESLLSSTYSNGYGGDESSFSDSEIDRSGDSEIDDIEEDGGSISDSEACSPISKYSWDYTRRYRSSDSGSSSSRISHFPDSLVIKEAKQRLSERWTMVTCEDISQEQVRLPRSTCTLGEMLSLNEVKKEDVTSIKDDKTVESSRKLPRSNSLPVSSHTFDNMVAKVQVSYPEGCKPTTDLMRRVSDFLFPKRKTARQKSTHRPSDCFDEKIEACFGGSQSPASHKLESNEKLALCEEKNDVSGRQNFTSTSEGTALVDVPISLICRSRKMDRLGLHEGLNSTRDQPSPTSVLDAPSEDSSCNEPESSGSTNSKNAKAASRSSAIEAVACSLSWDDATSESPSPGISRPPPYLPSDVDDEESECHVLVQNIMSSFGLDDNARSSMVFTGWHLPDCPLDPVLGNKLLELWEQRSYRRLIVDCVNVALLEIGENALLSAFSWSKAHTRTWRENSSPALGVEVWSILKDWIYGARMFVVSRRDNTGIMTDRVVKQEVEGSGWVKMMLSQVVDITEQIEGGVLEELVAEAVLDFAACRCQL
ncbi:hypothetical protein ACQ4PT_046339 [Festuca glaucescens]